MDEHIDVLGFSIAICYDKTGNWKRDKVILYQHPDQLIEERDALNVIQYLYNEGFIVDRRVAYQVLTD